MQPILKIAFVVGEISGDELAADLYPQLQKQAEKMGMSLQGVGLAGSRLQSLGVKSVFNIEEIAVMGFCAVLTKLPKIIRRVFHISQYIIKEKPDLVLLVDSPDFTHAVAKKVRKALPNVPIVQYVCPSVWAWRSGRALKMKQYIDHIFAILPFEVEALAKLQGPKATYVGHPLVNFPPIKNATTLRKVPTLLILPGSRQSEIKRMLPLFGEVLELLEKENCKFRAVLPAVPHLRSEIEKATNAWSCKVEIVQSTDNEKTFKQADVALAASGTVSLQLALNYVPMVIAYRLDIIARTLAPFLRTTWSIVLPNLIVGWSIVPEYLDENARAETLVRTLQRLLSDTPERKVQIDGFKIVEKKMRLKKTSAEIIADSLPKLIRQKEKN